MKLERPGETPELAPAVVAPRIGALAAYGARLRSRVWIAAGVFLATFAAVGAWAFCQPKVYRATATMQMLTVTTGDGLLPKSPFEARVGTFDRKSMLKVVEDHAPAKWMLTRMLTDPGPASTQQHRRELFRRFMQPYQTKQDGPAPLPLEILERNRKFVVYPKSLLIAVEYRHPDRHVAAWVADLLADEIMTEAARRKMDDRIAFFKRLEELAETQTETIETIERELQEFRMKQAAGATIREEERQWLEKSLRETRKNHGDVIFWIQREKERAVLRITSPVRRISSAVPAREGDYIAPDVSLILCAGAALGLCLALACGLSRGERTAASVQRRSVFST
ncbi:hypothetical protein OPIT5_09075 [Opitutaceae bacterium TAV5]|nr:hypothetical protein OPIT5_09075 [Opitutaceae bacterium TAV5]